MKLNFSLRRWGESWAWKLFPFANVRFNLKSGLVVSVASKSELATFKEIFVRQVYDEFLDRCAQPATVLDLGCNAGYFTLLLHHRARLKSQHGFAVKSVLVDANPSMVTRAESELAANGISARCVAGLIGERGKSMDFHITKESASSSTFRRPAKSRRLRLESLDLDALIARDFPTGLELIKCDIEGAEMLLAREWPAALGKTAALLVEWHHFAGPWPEFVRALQACGLRCAYASTPEGSPNFRTALFLPGA